MTAEQNISSIKKWVILCLAAILATTAGYTQSGDQNKVPELIARLSYANEDTAKVRLLAQILQVHLYYSTEKGLSYRKEAVELAEKLQWKLGIAMVITIFKRLEITNQQNRKECFFILI